MLTPAQIRDIAIKASLHAVAAAQAEAANAATPGAATGNFRSLPKNLNGDPEFSNMILTLDHLQSDYGNDGHIRNKMVMSTESTSEVIAKLLSYYKVSLNDNRFARILEVVGKAAETEYNGGILVLYLKDGSPYEAGDRGPICEVIVSTPAYDALVEHPDFGRGSSLLASSELVSAVGAALDRQAQETPEGKEYPLITLLQISQASFEAPEPTDASAFDGASAQETGGQ